MFSLQISDQGECRGRLFFGNFILATQKKVTAPRGMSALVANYSLHSTNPFDGLRANGEWFFPHKSA